MARDILDILWIFLVQLPLIGGLLFIAPGEDSDNDGTRELKIWFIGVIFGAVIITNIIWFRAVKPRLNRNRNTPRNQSPIKSGRKGKKFEEVDSDFSWE